MMAVVAGAPASAMPAPNGTSPSRKCQYDVPTSIVAKMASPMAIDVRPAAPATRTPRRAASSGETRDSGITSSAIGSRAAAARIGEKPEHELQVGQGQEQEAEHREELDGDRERPGAEAPAQEVARVEHRLVAAQLPADEGGDGRDTREEGGEGDRGRPAALGALDDAVHERRQAGRRQQPCRRGRGVAGSRPASTGRPPACRPARGLRAPRSGRTPTASRTTRAARRR